MAAAPTNRPNDGWHWTTDQSIFSQLELTKPIIDTVLEAMQQCDWPEADRFSVHLALEEALVNAIKHGNQFAEDKSVHVIVCVSAEKIYAEISDEGEGFDPAEVPDPTADDRLEIPSGRGIMLIRSFMSEVEYNAQGNCLIMKKSRGESS